VLLLGVSVLYFIGLVQIGHRGIIGFVVFLAIFGSLHVSVRVLAPRADPILLPIAAFLTGIGLLELSAIDTAMAGRRAWRPLGQLQAAWLGAGAAGFVLALFVFRRGLGAAWRVRYTLALAGLIAMIAPMIPGIGYTVNGARLWLRVGPLNFQPGEAAKVLIVLFLAGYLAERREMLALSTRRIGPIQMPDPRYLAPLLGIVGLALVIFVRQNDLGSSLLFFATFLAILWIATGKLIYPVLGMLLFAVGVVVALNVFGHVQVRFVAWLRPFDHGQTSGFQIARGWYAMAEGKLGGVGLGGSEVQLDLIPSGWTDLILVSIGYTLGLAGVIGIVIAYVVFLTRSYFVALRSRSDLHALAATGFGTVVGLQAALIAGGVTRVLPLTGVTLPFVSYGGSSLLANFVILGCLLAISNAESTTVPAAQELVEVGA
jgi:peptidoglycan glycosyltransferase